MKASKMLRRLDALSARIRPGGGRNFTLEALCRHCWALDRKGFRTLVTKECPGYRVFLEMFDREEADRNQLGRLRRSQQNNK